LHMLVEARVIQRLGGLRRSEKRPKLKLQFKRTPN
jgi:hypothetical protein